MSTTSGVAVSQLDCILAFDASNRLAVRRQGSKSTLPFTGASHAVLVALQHYGMLVADNGSDWFITGATDTRWDDNDLNQLKTVPASAFEVVQTGTIVH